MADLATATRRTAEESNPPSRVRRALIALWLAWILSATALFVNQFLFLGSGIGPGPSLGILSLIGQAAAFVFVRRGSPVARAVVVVFLVLATLPLEMLGRLIAEQSVWSASYTAAGFVLKASGVLLLFTGESRRWFAGSR